MLFLALRHLTSRKRQTFLTLLGILLGTGAYVAISGLMLGFQTFIIDQLVNNDAHVRITAREELLTERSLNESFFGDSAVVKWWKPPSGRKDNPYILAPGTWLERLQSDPKVAASSPQMVVQAIVKVGKATAAVRLIGSEPERQKRVSNIEQYMLQGKFSEIGTTGNRVAVGKDLLDRIGAAYGETINLSSGKSGSVPFRIVGVFRLGVKGLDETTVFGSLSDAQQLNETPSRVTDIAVRLNDVTEAGALAATWNLLATEKVQSWDQANEGIMSVFKMQDIVRNSMTVSILIVAAFGIYNILSLAISHKKREIAILRSMGFVPRDIERLFLIQGIILGAVGGLVGCLLGYVACLYLSTIEVSSNRGLGGNRMLISFDSMIYFKGFGLAFLSACVASFLPARAAGKLEPIDIIRSENE